MGVFEDSVSTFLRPIVSYLEDDSVSEVLVNGPDEIFIEQRGLLQKVDATFGDEQALQAAVRNIAQFVGRRIDAENPILDARLPDGSRVAAVLPPCSRKGTSLSIRKFNGGVPSFGDLIKRGSITKDAARFIDICVYLSKNIIISGGTGSGKTTLLNVIGSRIPKTQRTLVIEDSSELQIQSDHVVFFESQPPDEHGKGEVSIRDLIRSALRLRPDRIIVGEVRGSEAIDLITAMNTGHGGSMGTTHANTPVDALVRLETLAMIGGTQVPVAAIRRQIASAIHLVVQIKRMNDGSRKVVQISEVMPEVDEFGKYQVKAIFEFVQKGRNEAGEVVGEMVPTGYLPSFFREIQLNRIPFPKEKFEPPSWYIEHQKKTAA
ncbi:MAG: pilus assembly protein [Bdellovibrionaceae bacterium]|nr:pilus assembly protein [Pseudobdellovibrionaceae bacterium]